MKRKLGYVDEPKKIRISHPIFFQLSDVQSKMCLYDRSTKKIVERSFLCKLKQHEYSRVFGIKNLKLLRNERHIKDRTRFIISNNLHFGCTLVFKQNEIDRVIPFNSCNVIYFKVVKYYDIPNYIIFRRYNLRRTEDGFVITPASKVFICLIGDPKYRIDIKKYKEYDFIPNDFFTLIKVDSIKHLIKSPRFNSLFYFCFNETENIFGNVLKVFFLSKIRVQKNIKEKYDIIFKLYQNDLNVKNIFLVFIETESFINEIIPIYFHLTFLTSFPFESFFEDVGNPIVRVVDYLKMKECFKQKYKIGKPGTKTKINLKKHQEVFELHNKFDGDVYLGFVDELDSITKNGYIINKKIFEIDIWSCFGNSFLNIYEGGGYKEFKVLYDITKRLLDLRKQTKSEVVKVVCKLLVNAGCYGTLNMKNSHVFPLFPKLMKDIVINAQSVMKDSIEFLESNNLKRIFSKNDSHLLIFKINQRHKETLFDDILIRLNLFLEKKYPNSKFKLRGVHEHGVWFHQNNYVLKNKEYVIKGQLNSPTWPKTIRTFCLNVIELVFKGKKKIKFKEEWKKHKLNTIVTFDNFVFKFKDEYYIYVKNHKKTDRINIFSALSLNYQIDAEYTYKKFERQVQKMLINVVVLKCEKK